MFLSIPFRCSEVRVNGRKQHRSPGAAQNPKYHFVHRALAYVNNKYDLSEEAQKCY